MLYCLEASNFLATDPFCMIKIGNTLLVVGVVDGDPDLDAIQRLTRKDISVQFDVTFDPKAPDVVVPKGTYTSYNCQNTVR